VTLSRTTALTLGGLLLVASLVISVFAGPRPHSVAGAATPQEVAIALQTATDPQAQIAPSEPALEEIRDSLLAVALLYHELTGIAQDYPSQHLCERAIDLVHALTRDDLQQLANSETSVEHLRTAAVELRERVIAQRAHALARSAALGRVIGADSEENPYSELCEGTRPPAVLRQSALHAWNAAEGARAGAENSPALDLLAAAAKDFHSGIVLWSDAANTSDIIETRDTVDQLREDVARLERKVDQLMGVIQEMRANSDTPDHKFEILGSE
jgi:hypothetical protein